MAVEPYSLGAAHRETLTTRSNIAFWTGQRRHPAEALRLFKELLPANQTSLMVGVVPAVRMSSARPPATEPSTMILTINWA